jgi:hypothetical protein
MRRNYYPKLGGDLLHGCQRLAEGLGAVGAVAVLYRGMSEETEFGMTFATELKMGGAGFRKLTEEILNDTYSESITRPNKACVMLAEATGAECVMLFLIQKGGVVQVSVSQPKTSEFVAAFALQIANSLDEMN